MVKRIRFLLSGNLQISVIDYLKIRIRGKKIMKIKQASMCDFEKIISFYNVMCAVLGEKDFLPDGNKGGFPSQDMVRDAIYSGSQFIGVENDKIVAAYIMNHDCDNAYHTVQWHINAAENEVVVLHALRVLPDYGGRGYSKQLVEHAIQTAKSWGQKAIRLDCIVGNDVPMKVYTSFGFEYVDTAAITYADIGVPMQFKLYELLLV